MISRRFSLGQGSFKRTVASGKLFCGQTNQNLKFFLENWDAMSSGLKRNKDNPSCYQRSVSEACISDGMGLHECMWHGQLTHLERHHQCWKVYPSSRTTYAPIQTSSLSGKTLHFPTWQCSDHILHQLQHHGCVEGCGTEMASLQSRSFTHRKHLAHHKEEDATKKT